MLVCRLGQKHVSYMQKGLVCVLYWTTLCGGDVEQVHTLALKAVYLWPAQLCVCVCSANSKRSDNSKDAI